MSADYPYECERDQRGGDLPTLKARKDRTDEFRKKMRCDNPVRFYRLSEGDIAAAQRRKEIGLTYLNERKKRRSEFSLRRFSFSK